MKKIIFLITIFFYLDISAALFDRKFEVEKDFETYYLECEGTKASLSSKASGALTAAKMRIMMRDAWREGYITSIALTANARVNLLWVKVFDKTIQFKTKRFQGGRRSLGAIDRETGEISWIATKRFEFHGVCNAVDPWSPDDSLNKEYKLPKDKKKF
tara:strand:+ start:302 stop:775 length:474 start_codon:yes stop_codon:yes gene_type:complete